MGPRGDPHHRSGFPAQRRYPFDPPGDSRPAWRRTVLQGRVQPPHRQPQASPGALAVPLCAVQRLAQAGRAGDRGIERFHGDFRSLFRTPAGPALHRRDAGQHLEGKDRPDRLLRRPEPPGGGPHPDLRRVRTPGAGERWPFHGPVHLCRARHRLAGEQQHRRIDLPADAPRAVPDPDLADLQPRYRRHPGDPRPLRALSPALHPGYSAPTPSVRCSSTPMSAATVA